MSLFSTGAKHQVKSTQAYLDIAAIKEGVVVLKSGGMRAVLEVKSVNFALKSPQEQDDIVLRYQGFLNSLHFPLQILMHSRKLDLTDYLAKLRTRSEGEPNDMIRGQIVGYVAFMEKLLSVVNIMDKRFLVIVPFDPPSLISRGLIDQLLHPVHRVTISMTEKEFTTFAAELDQRVGLVTSGLTSLGLKLGRLTTKQLIELYYATYNPEESVKERLADATQLTTQYVGNETLPSSNQSPQAQGTS